MSKDFFSDVEKEELTLSTGKTIELPVEYQEWMWIQALFPAPAKKVKKLLPSEKLKPLLLLPGVALISIGAMEYRRINEVEPYNEVAVSIPVQYNPLMNLPGMPILFFPLFSPHMYRKFGVFVARLPVTTEEAFTFGVEIWGYPKSIEDIVFDEISKKSSCSIRVEGRAVFTLEVDKLSTKHRDINFYTYTEKDGKLVRTLVQTQGEYGISRMPGGAKCTLGDGPIANELKEVGMGKTAMGRIYAPRIQSMLHAAEEYIEI